MSRRGLSQRSVVDAMVSGCGKSGGFLDRIEQACSCSPHEASDPKSTPNPRLEKHAPTPTQPQSEGKAAGHHEDN